jgi:hypothetical protein
MEVPLLCREIAALAASPIVAAVQLLRSREFCRI